MAPSDLLINDFSDGDPALTSEGAAAPTGGNPAEGLSFEVGVTYDDPEGEALDFVGSAALRPVQAPYAASQRLLTVLETVRVPLACVDTPAGEGLTGVSFRFTHRGAVTRVAFGRR